MKYTFKSRHINTILHVLIWAIVLLLPYIVSNGRNHYHIGPLPGLFFTMTGVIHLLIFYGNVFWLYPKLFTRRYWWLYFLSSLLLIFISIWAKFAILATSFPEVLKDTTAYKFIFAPSGIIYIISVIYCMVRDKIRQEKQQQEQRNEQLAAELRFLRSQISPHFLFNVLTNLVALSRKNSAQLEPSLIMLSDLMRYMLYEFETKVTLQQEVRYLESYIALQQMRFGQDINIESKIIPGETPYTIEPMLLIPFVENAFKHGIVQAQNAFIKIQLLVDHDQLQFEVSNRFTKDTHSIATGSGIGLQNVRKRLALLYKNDYNLSILDTNDIFHIILKLKLVK